MSRLGSPLVYYSRLSYNSHLRLRLVKPAAFLLSLAGMVPHSGAASALARLTIAPVSYEDGGSIKFRAVPQDPEFVNAGDNIGQSGSYQVYSAPVICTYRDQWQLFSYDIFLRNTHNGKWLPFRVTAEPSPGSFVDGFREVDFTIADGAGTDNGKMRLPLHGLGNDQYLIVNMGDKPLPVRLGADNPVPIPIRNKLRDMKAILQWVRVSYDQPEFWATPPSQLTPNLAIAEQANDTFDQVRLHANTGKALANTFFRASSGVDTYLRLDIRYAVQSCGEPRSLAVRIPVQFVPSLSYLAFAVLPGVLLGSTLRLAQARRRQSVRAWFHAFVTAMLGAALLELLAIVLLSLHCEFVLFGLKLDPFQFPQVLLMGALVGVFGVNISDLLQKAMQSNAKKGAGGLT